MITLKDISYIDWQVKINSLGDVVQGVEEINQSIAIILLTRKGSLPHRVDFGSNIHLYLDYPINEISAHIIRETTDAISKWETRITISTVNTEIAENSILINIEWTLKETIIKGITQISYERTSRT